MDVSDYLKSGLKSYHKSQGVLFGTRLSTNFRSQKLKAERKNTRDKLISAKRCMSPYISPHVSIKEPSKEEIQTKKRSEQLKQWKQYKMKKIEEEKSKRKPIFKVTRVNFGVGVSDLENVNKTIKGKFFKSNLNRNDHTLLTSNTKGIDNASLKANKSFAPKHYQFKGPINIKPIPNKKCSTLTVKPIQGQRSSLSKIRQKILIRQENVFDSLDPVLEKKLKKVKISPDNELATPKSNPKIYKKTPAKSNNIQRAEHQDHDKENKKVNKTSKEYDLRSRKITLTKGSEIPKVNVERGRANSKDKFIKVKKLKGTNIKNVLETFADINSIRSELSTERNINENLNTTQSVVGTPHNLESKTPISQNKSVGYISPFVTISRGKDSARKEYHSRKSKGGLYDISPDIENSTGPRAGAAYFHNVLNSEISRIQDLCDEWNLYKEKEKPPEEACGMINVAIGQAQLLLEKKFKQFRNLINSCEARNSIMSITCEDLHGYWDTAYIQVENVNLRFENLVKMRSNDWEEIVPKLKPKPARKTIMSKPKVQVSSTLRDAIRAARNKAKTLSSESDLVDIREVTTTNGGFVSIKTPNNSPHLLTSTSRHRISDKKRKSLLTSVLTNESQKRGSSPGLVMLKIAQTAKSLENELNTPGRSILKSRQSKSNVKRSKSVLFKSEESSDNMVPEENLICLSDDKDPPRMSLRRRLAPNKLF